MSIDAEQRRAQCADLREQAKTAGGVGRSVQNLAPVVAGELSGLAERAYRDGKLAEQWEAAKARARDSDDVTYPDGVELAAVAAMLLQFAAVAGARVRSHGTSLVDQSGVLSGKAAGIEEMLDELAGPSNGVSETPLPAGKDVAPSQ